jgi:hypothetical protein
MFPFDEIDSARMNRAPITSASCLLASLIFALLLVPSVKAQAQTCQTDAVGQVCRCKVLDLHPTQFSIGFAEVEAREKKIADLNPSALTKMEEEQPEPVVKGPGQVLYIIDHHHLARILAELHVEQTMCKIVGDLSDRSEAEFVAEMTKRNWLYLHDETGAPKQASELPASVLGLKDDPYRSLAGLLGKEHGFHQNDEPFAEFRWAAFLRPRISLDDVQHHPDKALELALEAAKSKEACGLPGYMGQQACEAVK